MKKPNVLYIHSHDTGRYIAPYGHAIETPNLQRLAEEGVLFRQAFCGNPTCSASRACLLTGQCAHSNGMIGLAHRGFSLNDYSRHILHTLRKAGYTSVLSGHQHIASGPDSPLKIIGYDRYLGDGEVAQEKAAEFLDNAPKQPFFLSVGFLETHRPFPTEKLKDDPRCCLPPAPVPDTPETRHDLAGFKTLARVLDEKMAHVLDALERNNLAKNTLVICTTDHGIAFPRMKCNLTDGGIGVMLIMRGPDSFTGGKVVDGLVSHVDIFPTVCDLLSIDRPDWLQGVSFVPLVTGETKQVRDEIFAEVNYHAACEPMRCVRTKRWKYIKRYDGRTRPVLPNCDNGPSKTVWLEAGWADISPSEEALYDLVFDPNETNNLASDRRCASVLEDMKARLDKWMRETGDPILKGDIAAPKGAKVNNPDGISAREKPMIIGG